jgi:enamine deaminase RidA (YjgF/YER057c/UK114 family)
VERTLATAGASWKDVVHVNSYHVGGFPPVVNETMSRLYRHYMPDHAPIWTELGVEALGAPDMRIEIRVTAIVSQTAS